MIVNLLQVIDGVKFGMMHKSIELSDKVTTIFLQNLIFCVIFVQYF